MRMYGFEGAAYSAIRGPFPSGHSVSETRPHPCSIPSPIACTFQTHPEDHEIRFVMQRSFLLYRDHTPLLSSRSRTPLMQYSAPLSTPLDVPLGPAPLSAADIASETDCHSMQLPSSPPSSRPISIADCNHQSDAWERPISPTLVAQYPIRHTSRTCACWKTAACPRPAPI